MTINSKSGRGWRQKLSLETLAAATANPDSLELLTRYEPMRTARLAVAGFIRNDDLLRASALSYTTGLSLIPILAVALSALSAFGGLDHIRPLIEQYLTGNNPTLTAQLLSMVGNVDSRALGSVGGATLLITVITTLGTVEAALNAIFHVPRDRTLLRKFSDYLSVTFTMPLLLVAASGLQAAVYTRLPNLFIPGIIVSDIMTWAGFFFLYVFFPNTWVKWSAALIGSFVAAVLLQVAQSLYFWLQGQATQYRAIYGALAAIPVLLVWIYLSWAIILFGAEIAAARQRGRSYVDIDEHSPNFVRAAALMIMIRLGERMMGHRGIVTIESLASEFGVDHTPLRTIVHRLREAGLAVEGKDDDESGAGTGLFLGRDVADITVDDILRESGTQTHALAVGDRRLVVMLDRLAAVEKEILGSMTLGELLAGSAAGNGEPAHHGGNGHQIVPK